MNTSKIAQYIQQVIFPIKNFSTLHNNKENEEKGFIIRENVPSKP
jgi:hypothetical protein